jgi:Tol biopolymer transport system component
MTLAVAWAPAASAAATTVRTSVNTLEQQANGGSVTAAVSSDGTHIAFSSSATNLSGGTHNTSDVYVRDTTRQVTDLVSKASNGANANGRSLAPAISADGQVIAFQSIASNLSSNDTNGVDDIYVHDRRTGQTSRVSVSTSNVQGNAASSDPAISADGRYVAYTSQASNLVSGDTNGTTDVFVYDRIGRTTTRASVGTTGVESNGASRNPSISRDGARVAFESAASNLIAGADTDGTVDVFVGGRSGVSLRASESSIRAQGNGFSNNAALSADGRSVAFESRATNLVNGDTNAKADIFLQDLITRQTIRVTNGRNSGTTNDPANGDSGAPSLSSDGRVVAYHSAATNLGPGDTNGAALDVYVTHLNRPLGAQNQLASAAPGAGSGNAASATASLSGNGLVVGFHSNATNLMAGDTNNAIDVFKRSLQ